MSLASRLLHKDLRYLYYFKDFTSCQNNKTKFSKQLQNKSRSILKFTEKVDLKNSLTLYMVMDANQTYHDHFAIYINIESLCCIPEPNMMYVNYTSILKNACNQMWLTNKKTNSYYQRTSLMTLEQNKIRTPYQVCFSKISLILNQVKTEHQSLGLSVDGKKLNSKIQNSNV